MNIRESFKQLLRIGSDGQSGYIYPGGDIVVGYEASVAQALQNAYRHPIVCIAVSWLVKQVANTPLVMFRTVDDGEQERIEEHPLLALLNSPSEFMSGSELLSVAVRDILTSTHGQAFWRKDRLQNGEIESLTFLPARDIRVIGGAEELISRYEYRPQSTSILIEYDVGDIVHLRLEPNPRDPKNGLSPLVCVANELMLDSGTQEFIREALDNKGVPGGLLMPPADVSPISQDVAKETRDYVKENFSGSKRGEMGVLRATMQYVNTGLGSDAMTNNTVQDRSESRICAAYGIPNPVVVGLSAGDAQSRVGAATDILYRAAWTNAVIPIQNSISDQINRQLLPEFVEEAELDQYELDFDRSNITALEPNMLQEAQRWAMLVRSGIATRADARRAQDLEVGDEDELYLLPSSIVPSAPGEIPAPPQNDTSPALGESPNGVPQFDIASANRSKQTDEIDQLLDSFTTDRDELELVFTDDLEATFDDLGTRAEAAFREFSETIAGNTSLTRSKLAALDVGTKQTDEEINQEVSQVIRGINFTMWEQGLLIPAYDAHTLRTLNTTVGTVNSTLQLGVNLPDPVQQRILENGGLRRGLIDFNSDTRDSLFRSISAGREAGEGPAQLGRRIRSQVPSGPFPNAGSRYRAELIARTETAHAQNVVTRAIYEESDVVVGVMIYDGDLDDICAPLNGMSYSLAEAADIPEIGHPNCTRAFAPLTSLPE